jgi:sensor histidine kinase regulating citrate/malate metabolism
MTIFEVILDALISMIPPILMGVLVYLLFRSIFRADQRARDTYQQIEAEERAKLAEAKRAAETAAEGKAKTGPQANSEQP